VEEAYLHLKARWLAGERERDLALQLMFFAWMHWAEPPFVTGMADDPSAPGLWREVFDSLSVEQSADAEILFVSGIMAHLFPWVLGNEQEWEQRGEKLMTRAREVAPGGIAPAIFEGRGEYGRYFARQAAVGSR
jgi:hypothetical protein